MSLAMIFATTYLLGVVSGILALALFSYIYVGRGHTIVIKSADKKMPLVRE